MAENLAALIDDVARARPTQRALVWPGGALTWHALAGRVDRCAGALAARGVRPGSRLALALPNGWEFAVAFLAGLKCGATVAPLNPRLTPHEMASITEDLTPALVLTALPGAAEVTAESDDVSTERRVGNAGVSTERRVGNAGVSTERRGDAPALILYTSGSTGRPKGSVFSHEALIAANRSWAGPVMGLTPRDVVLGVLPFAHSFGLNGALLAPLLAGAAVAPLDRFTPETTLEAIATLGVTVFPAVATMFRRVLDVPSLSREQLATVRLALSGAAPCPWELASEWRERTGIRLLRGYGMTELFRPISYLCADGVERPEAIGRAVPGVELRVLDDDGTSLEGGQVGELHVWSPARLEGYLHTPDGPGPLAADGWFATGDLACVDGDGLVSIVGRKKDLILRGGYSVSPPEVEAVLMSHPAVGEAAVVGRPHPELGEDVVAFVALRPQARVEPEELIAHCASRLAPFKCPRQVRMVPALPRGETGKVQKWRLA